MSEIDEYLKNSRVLLVGGGPTASILSEKEYDFYDRIVRMNNYKKVNSERTDIFFSYFGQLIEKTREELEADGVEWLVNKYPNADMSRILGDLPVSDKDYRWVYEMRRNWWFGNFASLSARELSSYIDLMGGYMPTTGMCAALWLKNKCRLTLVGFDCFKSDTHNLNEKWDRSGGHRPEREAEVFRIMHETQQLEWSEYERMY